MSADQTECQETFTIVTTSPSKFASRLHDRMSVVLEPADFDAWLTGMLDQAAALMKPANESALTERAVSNAIGNVRNNSPDLLAAPG